MGRLYFGPDRDKALDMVRGLYHGPVMLYQPLKLISW